MLPLLLASVLDSHAQAPHSVPRSVPLAHYLPARGNRHPGQNGPLTAEQKRMAEAAWKYFENNFQAETCLYNSVDGYPSTTMWDTASAVAGLVSAFELELIDAKTFDERFGCLLASLQQLPLYRSELPNKAYHTATLAPVDYNNQPAEIGISALDIGRILLWLAIVRERYPLHAGAVDQVVLRWHFCNVVDRGGAMFGATNGNAGEVIYLQEGRLGYEEYAANGFQLWGFDTTEASRIEPSREVRIEGVPILYDGRDPEKYGAHTYVVTEPYLLTGLEMTWDLPNDRVNNDGWASDAMAKKLAKRVYRVQAKRYRATGTFTARTEHHVKGAPHFVYDTIFSDGEPWHTMTDTGEAYPELAAVSTKAAIGLWVLYDTPYTRRLATSVLPLVDPEKGIYEGYLEASGERIDALTANTNGIVLEALLYRQQGKLYRNNNMKADWQVALEGTSGVNTRCLPREYSFDDGWVRGRYIASVQRRN